MAHRLTHEKRERVIDRFYLPRHANFDNYSPDSFGWGGHLDPTTAGNQKHLIVPFSFHGVDFPGGIHRDFYNVAHNVLNDLYPLIPVDSHKHDITGHPNHLRSGECGCFVDRLIAGGSSRSFHSWGLAIDINWTQNPMGEPSDYGSPFVLPQRTALIAKRWGCEWGGGWQGRRDAMHIECHLSPHVARKVKLRAPNQRTIILK